MGMMLYYTRGRVGVGVGSLCLEAIECLEGEGKVLEMRMEATSNDKHAQEGMRDM